jgi:two-component system, OmpR family, phosphate regulon response regulator PhoB
MSSTILVIEDEPAIQELIAVNLSFAGHKVLRAYDAEQADTLIRAELPDLILLDWMLPGISGLAFARRLRNEERTRHVPVIMLTAKGAEQDKLDGLEAGADDYITKPFSPKELMARIKAVLRRRAPQLTDDLTEVAGLALDPSSHRLSGNGQPLNIGPTEFRLLHFFMTHAERVFSRSQLLDQVWGDHVFVEERTVDVHIRRLRKALEPSGHDAAAATALPTKSSKALLCPRPPHHAKICPCNGIGLPSSIRLASLAQPPFNSFGTIPSVGLPWLLAQAST